MVRFRWSSRSLILVTLLVGFDCAATIRAAQRGRAAHAMGDYLAVFGAALLAFNALAIAFARPFGRVAGRPAGSRWSPAPTPAVVARLYAGVVVVAVLSVLFLSSGRF